MATATGIDFNNAPANAVTNCTGDIAIILGGANCGGATGIVGDIAAGTIPLGNGGAVAYSDPFWMTLNIGGVVFALTSITAYEHSNTFNSLSLAGTGIMSSTAPGYAPTVGSFTFTAQQAGQTFSFSSSQVSSGRVPVPGTIALLGLGLLGVGFARRSKV